MPRLLLVAYYFPPLGGSGVQRVAKLAKYLPAHGWSVDVLTARPGAYFARDERLRAEVDAAGARVHATASLDPTRADPARAGRETVSLPGEARRKLWHALSSALFVPDNKVGWLPFAVREAGRIAARRPFAAVLASAPPYSGLLAGALAARRARVPLVLDLRDDWLGNPRHVYPTAAHRAAHAALERWAFRQARAITVISDAMLGAVAARHPDLANRLHVIPQGFDPADLAVPAAPRIDGRMRLLYAGMFYDAQRPDFFLHGLAAFLERRPDARARIEAVFCGLVPPGFDALVTGAGLAGVVRYEGYLPHEVVSRELMAADVLWMTVGRRPGAEGISTGKLFEYVGTRKPVLGLVPEGTARRALEAYGAAFVAEPDDVPGIAGAIGTAFEAWEAGDLPSPDAAFVAAHDRRVLAGRVAALLEAVVS